MKRKELLEGVLNSQDNVEAVIEAVIKADNKFLVRQKRKIADSVEDLKEELEKRLSVEGAIDSSTVESCYAALEIAREKLELYEKFEKEFLK